MSALQLLIAIGVLAFVSPVSGQEGQRGSIPPGTSRDGSAPGDGALKGGAILPGAKASDRCKDLSGTLREDCLRQARDAAAGAGAPSDTRKPKTERVD
jgi:hypothetical protein